MNISKLVPVRKAEFLASIVIYHIVVCLMAACLGLALQQLGQRLVPNWHNGYIVWVAVVVSLESMLTARLVRQGPIFTSDWLLHRLAEWVVILVALKLMLYLVYDPAQILKDVLLWDEDFWNTFFTSEYLVVVGLAMFFWAMASGYTAFLLDLEDSVEDLDVELEGTAVRDRQSLRAGMVAMVFGVGLILLVIVAFIHVDLPALGPVIASVRINVLLLLGYFFLGFVLLALTQYFILRARWYLQRIPASPDVGRQWAFYSLGLLLAVALIVILLPTGYSSTLYKYIQIGVGYFIAAVTYVVMAMVAPLVWLIHWLTSGITPQRAPSEPVQPPPPLNPPTSFEPDLWIQVLKSLLFWTIFFSVIVFSFRFYLRERQDFVENLKKRRATRWLGLLIEWLQRRFRRTRYAVETAFENTAAQVREAARRSGLRVPGFERIARRLPARQQVLLTYLALLRWNDQNGIHRLHAQTPVEYAEMIAHAVPASRGEIDVLTELFMEARYTRHSIQPEQAEMARGAFARFKRISKLLAV